METILSLSDIEIKGTLALKSWLLTLIEIVPAFFFPLLWPFLASLVVEADQRSKSIRIEIFFFACAGAVGAYVNYLSRGSLLDNLIPSMVLLVAFLAQLLGLSRSAGKIPLVDPKVLLSGAGAALSFAIASRYFLLMFGAKDVVAG